MSKYILILFLNSFAILYAFGFDTYDEALKLQQQNDKIIMIDVMRSDCHYCAKMAALFENNENAKWIKARFIPVKLNLDFDDLPLGLNVFVTPSFFFVNKNQKILKKIVGAFSMQDFKDLTKNIK